MAERWLKVEVMESAAQAGDAERFQATGSAGDAGSGEDAETHLIAALAEIDGLRRAMATRSVIDLAKGILMERHALDEEAAFALLRRLSQQSNRKLTIVALQVVKDLAAGPDADGSTTSDGQDRLLPPARGGEAAREVSG